MNYNEIHGGGGRYHSIIFSLVMPCHFKQVRGGGKYARLQVRIKILSSKSPLLKSRNLLFDAKEHCWASLEMHIKTYQGVEVTVPPNLCILDTDVHTCTKITPWVSAWVCSYLLRSESCCFPQGRAVPSISLLIISFPSVSCCEVGNHCPIQAGCRDTNCWSHFFLLSCWKDNEERWKSSTLVIGTNIIKQQDHSRGFYTDFLES